MKIVANYSWRLYESCRVRKLSKCRPYTCTRRCRVQYHVARLEWFVKLLRDQQPVRWPRAAVALLAVVDLPSHRIAAPFVRCQ